MKRHRSRREFLKAVPAAATGAWAGASGFAGLLTSHLLGSVEAAPQGSAPVTRPFLMVALGDSVMWGEGLPETLVLNSTNPGMKFRNMVQGWLLGHLGGRGVLQFNRSQTGAQIIVGGPTDYAPGFSGDIPSSYPSIGLQVQLAARDLSSAGFSADMVDLVLLDGGINDVNIREILLPTNSTGKIQQKADEICIHRMSELIMGAPLPGSSLPLDLGFDPSASVMNTFKNAAIVLTGYFQIASEQSDVVGLEAFLSALGIPVFLGPVVKDRMVANSLQWKNATDAGFLRIVTAANQRDQTQRAGGPPRVAFASPTFGPENAFAAGPATFLFGVANQTFPVSVGTYGYGDFSKVENDGANGVNEPTDPLLDAQWRRARECMLAQPVLPQGCMDACMGHPNPRGAQAYAASILTQIWTILAPYLTTRGLSPPPPPLQARACPTADGRACSRHPALPRGHETETPLRALVNVTSNGRPVAGASVVVDGEGGRGGITDAGGNVVVTYYLFAYSARQEQGTGAPDVDPRGKPVRIRNADKVTFEAPTATASKAGFQPFSFTLPR